MQCNRMFECKDKSDEVSCDDGKYKKFLKKSGGVKTLKTTYNSFSLLTTSFFDRSMHW